MTYNALVHPRPARMIVLPDATLKIKREKRTKRRRWEFRVRDGRGIWMYEKHKKPWMHAAMVRGGVLVKP